MRTSRGWVIGTVALAAAACSGSQGPQGPAGPPADRSKLYCNSETGHTGTTTPFSTPTLTVSSTCRSKTDIPWQGSCVGGTLPTGYYLQFNGEDSWDNPNAAAGWKCIWAPGDGAPALGNDFAATAEICCFAIPS